MIHYIKLTRYTSGESLAEQLDNIVEASQFDADLRVFFSNSNSLTTKDIAYMMKYFTPSLTDDFKENILFTPTPYGLHIAESGQKFANNKWW